jgi:thermitase
MLITLWGNGAQAAKLSGLGAQHGTEFLVKFHTPRTTIAAERFAAIYGGHRRAGIAEIGVQVLRFPATADHRALLARLQADPAVVYAEPNAIATTDATPNDPGYPNQWGLAQIQAPQSWDIQSGSVGVVIAIVDTGIDSQHPELSSKSVQGWNFDASSPSYNTAATADDNGHGTHVAGIAAAATNNSLGVAGTCPNCLLMPVKVLGANSNGTYDAVASGIIYAADRGARIINLSLSGPIFSQALQDAVNYAASRGALLIAAAGNNSTNAAMYPAALPNVMAVAATNSDDLRAGFSNFNSYISVAAPGVGIYSTSWSPTNGSTYISMNGTSMSTPFVAGLAGLLAAQDGNRTSAVLRGLIETSADDLDLPGWDQDTGYGRINALRALSGRITGVATDATSGAALANVQVEALQGGQIKATTTTQSNGAYALPLLPPGTYDLRASLLGYTSATRAGVIVRSGQETANVALTLKRTGALAGKVVTSSGRKPLAGVTVQAIQSGQVRGSATTDSYGNYQLANLAAGTYDVRAAATGYQTQTRAAVVINAGQTTTGINFSLSR